MQSRRTTALRAALVAILIIGLAWVAGGQALLGRIDPALAIPLATPPVFLLAVWNRKLDRRARLSAIAMTLAILAATQWILARVFAGGGGGAMQAVLTMVASGAAAMMADIAIQRFWARRALALVIALVLCGIWFVASHVALATLYRTSPDPDAPATTLMTGLPLRWSGGGDLSAMIAQGTQDDPALARLEAAGPLRLVDSLVDQPPPAGGALLLAHPRALAPRELVAVDAFVRGGGRAVILADALSGWPPRWPFGDARNPPVTSLLTPLLSHWGVTLAAAPMGEVGAQPVDIGSYRLRLFSTGRFERLPTGCQVYADRRIAHCPVGRGSVWLVGDADLLFAPLWQPPVEGADHLRRADTIEWLIARLRADAARHDPWLWPIWIRRADAGA